MAARNSRPFQSFWEQQFSLDPIKSWTLFLNQSLGNIHVPTLNIEDIPTLRHKPESVASLTDAAVEAFKVYSTVNFEVPAVVVSLHTGLDAKSTFDLDNHQSMLNHHLQNLRCYKFVKTSISWPNENTQADVYYDNKRGADCQSTSVYNVYDIFGSDKGEPFLPEKKKIQDLHCLVSSYAGGLKKSFPFNQVKKSAFNKNEYLYPFNPYWKNDVLGHLKNTDKGVNVPCLVTYPPKLVTPLCVNDLKLAEYDLLVWSTLKNVKIIQRIHIILAPSALEAIKDENFLEKIRELEQDFTEDQVMSCPSFYANQRFIFTLQMLYNMKLGFYVYYQCLGDVLLVRPGCMRFTISMTLNQSIGVNFWMTEWLDISDRFSFCKCPMPPMHGNVVADEAVESRERRHGMDKSTLHTPSDFETAVIHWTKAQHLSPRPNFFRNIYAYYSFEKFVQIFGEMPAQDVIQDTIANPSDCVLPTTPTNDAATDPSDVGQEEDIDLTTTEIGPENIPETPLFRHPSPEMIGKNLAENVGIFPAKSVSLAYSKNKWKKLPSSVKNKRRRELKKRLTSLNDSATDSNCASESSGSSYSARSIPVPLHGSGLIPEPTVISFLDKSMPGSALGPLVKQLTADEKKKIRNKKSNERKKRSKKRKAAAGKNTSKDPGILNIDTGVESTYMLTPDLPSPIRDIAA